MKQHHMHTSARRLHLRPLAAALLALGATGLALPARAAEPDPDVARLLADADRLRMSDDDLDAMCLLLEAEITARKNENHRKKN